jgi:hypothetical protein
MANNSVKLRLERVFLGETYTIGKLYISDKYFCDVLEDRVVDKDKSGKFEGKEVKIFGESAIPYGTYDVVLNESPKFKRILPRLLNVPHFDGILIHAGNTDKDSNGCLLVGLNKEKGKVINSRFYEEALVKELSKYKQISIEIV